MEDEDIVVTSEDSETNPNTHTTGAVPSCVYSGADIKLVVHLPPPEAGEANIELRNAELELERIQQQLEVAGSEDSTTQIEARILELEREENSLIEQIQATEAGSAARTILEDQVTDVQDELLELNEQLQQGDIVGSDVAELRERETELTRQIADLREEGAGPLTVTKTLAEITTLSISTHREKSQVRTLGSVYPRSITRGPRCLPASEKVFVKDRGYISIRDVNRGDFVQSSSTSFNRVVDSWYQGEKLCYKLVTQDGYCITASYDHPISTPEGWKSPQQLQEGDIVHVVGGTPCPSEDFNISDSLLKMIAYLIGDGSTHKYKCKSKPSEFYKVSLSIGLNELSSIGQEVEGCLLELDAGYMDNPSPHGRSVDRAIHICKPGKGLTDWKLREYNDLHKALLEYDLYSKYSYQKRIPSRLLSGMSIRQTSLFLSRLFATDGCYSISQDRKYIEARYVSTSENLIDEVRLLLSKLGISSIKSLCKRAGDVGGREEIVSRHNAYKLTISSAAELVKFIRRVGIFGKDEKILPLENLLVSRIKNKYLPISRKELRSHIKEAAVRQGVLASKILCKFNSYSKLHYVTPRMALMIAEELKDNEFTSFVCQQIDNLLEISQPLLERPITSIKKVGVLPVYDLEVEDRHEFIANFIRVHNTVSGSIVFTTFYTHIFHEFFGATGLRSTGVGDWDRYRWTSYITDQLPPMDISIVFANEYGNLSWMALLGVEFLNEGMVMSIEDLFVEGTVQYIARDFDPIRSVAQRTLQRNRGVGASLTGTDLLLQEVQARAGGRRIPWL